MGDLSEVRAGYLPLLDSAVLLVAADRGFAEERGVRLILSRETSWATIRDRMGVGHFDAAHVLAPMPIAASLGIGPLAAPMRAPIVLALGGNAVTVAKSVARLMVDAAGFDPASVEGPRAAGAALRTVIERRSQTGMTRLRLAVVHRHSSHNYDLRYWLAACGIDPVADVEITVVPPPLMPDALASGQIDGFSVGEPWNTIAVRRDVGTILTTKAEIWRGGPEKVLGVSSTFADRRRETALNLIAALAEAAKWCAAPENRVELAELLARPEYLGLDPGLLRPALEGVLEVGGGALRTVSDFVIFGDGPSGRPRPGHGRWLAGQMARWGDAEASSANVDTAAAVFAPDLYDAALGTESEATSAGRLGLDDREPPSGHFDAETTDLRGL